MILEYDNDWRPYETNIGCILLVLFSGSLRHNHPDNVHCHRNTAADFDSSPNLDIDFDDDAHPRHNCLAHSGLPR